MSERTGYPEAMLKSGLQAPERYATCARRTPCAAAVTAHVPAAARAMPGPGSGIAPLHPDQPARRRVLLAPIGTFHVGTLYPALLKLMNCPKVKRPLFCWMAARGRQRTDSEAGRRLRQEW